jgi:hypothetical protein
MQIYEILNGVESCLNGKLYINFNPPEVLMTIFKTVTFLSYRQIQFLFSGFSKNGMCLYYEYPTVTVVGSHHDLRLIISVPLKNSDSYYTFYTLQFRVVELNKYVQMIAESPYLVLDDSR